MWSRLRSCFQIHCQEIAEAESLRWVGFLLAFSHFATYLFNFRSAVYYLANSTFEQCWSYFPHCESFRIHSEPFWQGYFFLYAILAIASMLLFYQGHIRSAVGSLLALTIMKTAFLVLDARFMGNYHFMHLLYSAVFLFFPRKEISLKWLMVFFYVAAGSLKLNEEWLLGASIGKFLFPEYLQLLSLAYVVFLELCVVWGLLSDNKKVRWLSLIQFVLFHLISFYWVGFFYPVVVLGMLMIFPLSWLNTSSSFRPSRPSMVFIALLLFLSVCQIFSFFGKDPALYTQRRLLSMNMFDARSNCSINFYLHKDNQIFQYSPDLTYTGVRVRCDAGVVLNMSKDLCREQSKDPSFKSLDVSLLSKRTTDLQYQVVYKKNNVCQRIATMSYMDWLKGDL